MYIDNLKPIMTLAFESTQVLGGFRSGLIALLQRLASMEGKLIMR